MSDKLITSRHNPRIKQAMRLRERRGREQQQRIIIDGAREVARAVQSGVVLDEVLVCLELCHTPECQALVSQLRQSPADVWEVTPEVFAKVAFGERAEGVIGIARPPARTLDDLTLPPQALVAVLEGIEKPGNVGAVLRTADGAQIAALIVADGGTDLYNPNAIRASIGTIFSVPVCAAPTPEVLAWLRARSVPMYAAQVGASARYTEVDYRTGGAIVLGSEATGLSPVWSGAGVVPVSIPMLGLADSLNVSAAAAIMFYEALRQRRA